MLSAVFLATVSLTLTLRVSRATTMMEDVVEVFSVFFSVQVSTESCCETLDDINVLSGRSNLLLQPSKTQRLNGAGSAIP